MSFRQWIENAEIKPTVSFDFDGVLHIDVHPGTIHPLDFFTTDLRPYRAMHKKVREEAAAGNRIIVVSGRDEDGEMDEAAIAFCRMWRLPISKFIFTNNMPKVSILKREGVIRHYDDDPRLFTQLMGTGIEFIHITPPAEESQDYDSGLRRPQNYRAPKLKKKRDKTDKLFGEATKKRKKPKLCAGIFFTDGRAVLMLKRRPPGDHANTWGLPGGHLEDEESPLAAAQREAREECGRVSGKKFGVLTNGAWTCFFYKVPKLFAAELSEEHDAWEWVRFEQLKHIHLHPLFRKQLRKYVAFVKSHI